MNYINNVINYIEGLDITNIIDLAVAIAVIIIFLNYNSNILSR